MDRDLHNVLQAAARSLKNFEIFVNSRRVSDRISPNSIFWVAALIGACPATNTNLPETTACEYGPSGLGNSEEETTCLSERRAGAPRSVATIAPVIPDRNII